MKKVAKKKKVKRQYFKERKTKAFLKISIILMSLIVVSVYFLIIGKSGYLVRRKMKKQIVKIEEEIEVLKKEIIQLKNEVKRLESDSSYIEEQARELGMVREGEKIIEFIPSGK
ncbi:MAG: septum formation initiator family protein [bacterium]|nr:septum formation initiator family protein [bacterium]